MDQNNWFFYGIPANNEPVYGLYEPVHNLFFLVHTNLDSIKKLVLLFSSRFTLHVCKISDAKNYHPNLIDNTVCKNWSLSNKEEFPITRFPDIDRIIVPSTLIESNSNSPWNFHNDQQYMMAVCNWLENDIPKLHELQDKYKQLLTSIGGFNINEAISELPGMPFTDKYSTTINLIESTIYNEFEFAHAYAIISNALNECYA